MTAMEEDLAFLEHFGIRGMRWGRRKPKQVAPQYQRQRVAGAQINMPANRPTNIPANIQPKPSKKKTASGAQTLAIGGAIVGAILLHEAGVPMPNVGSAAVSAGKALVKGYGKFSMFYLKQIQKL